MGKDWGVEQGAEWLGQGLIKVAEGKGWTVRQVEMRDVEGYLDVKHDHVLKVLDWDEELARIDREKELKAANAAVHR